MRRRCGLESAASIASSRSPSGIAFFDFTCQ
jgi:hypothetical protein